MTATTPEQCNELVIKALSDGDVEAAVSHYETDATLVLEGKSLNGQAAYTPALAGFCAIKPSFEITPAPTVTGDDIALTSSTWRFTATDPEGNPISAQGRSVEVMRRQADGEWKIVIDIPDLG